MYYLRTRPAVNAIQYTVEKGDESEDTDDPANTFLVNIPTQEDNTICISCQG